MIYYKEGIYLKHDFWLEWGFTHSFIWLVGKSMSASVKAKGVKI
jgi:hypothetical protein